MSDAQNPPDRGGRPVVWTPVRTREAMAKYLDLVASGVLDVQIYQLPDMPSSWTVRQWMATMPGFAQQVAEARRQSANVLAEESVVVWDTPMPGGMSGGEASAWAQLIKGKSASKQWLASVRDREGFGDSKNVTIQHKPLQSLTLDELMLIAAQGKPLIDGTVCAQSDDDEAI